ncbi:MULTISPECIES: AsmA family protein [unclassified Tenacibaculum]|uniref:AsmA family protein n=1 Tax=unclassified Tenacibaculum TaxID=2635139 RepID=UPI001F2D339D|nr:MULTISPECIES: AsmA family protein [unclassified Tenacibaculum]MCF2874613.1 AsmA family protein [Tenacibaculum sp. Cn5-1]MCF2934321.1 AsmA family protein [Tenacibaculum sp. Cn5-34]MCG7510531.1 AsmA family protein [Tenacibaculum sp. Cn5-46]
MKKIYKIVLGVVIAIFVILVSIPLLFQDKIIGLVKQTVNNNVNAKVDFSDANLSLIRNFPNISVQLSNTTVINNKPFEGDTLLYANDIRLNLRLTELFKSSTDQLNIKSFSIDNAKVNVLVDKNGNANYDISKPKEVTQETTTENTSSSNFGLSIDSYSISNATIKYTDKKGKMHLSLNDFNHSGSGDFSQSNMELDTKTSTLISFGMDGTSYAKNQKIQLDAILGMDLVNQKFSFLKNEAKLNNLPLIFDGYVQINKNNQEVDINFKTPSSDFKNFLGLIPEAYTKNIANVTTSGNFSVNGKVNGIIDNSNIPKLDIILSSKNASFKYPDLPKTVRNINIDAQIKNTTGKTQNTYVNIEGLSFKIDEDTFSGKGSIHNLTTNPLINATLNGTLNLANINKAYPVDLKNELRGILKANLHTKFDLDAIQKSNLNRIKNNGHIEVSDFVFSSKDIVNPINIKNTKVDFTPTTISLTKFDANTGKSDINATGKIQNLLGFLLSNKKLQGDFKVNSNSFYVSDFMQENTNPTEKKEDTPKEEKPTESLKIPAFLDCKIFADAKTVYYDNLKLRNVKGTLLLKDEKATLQNVNAGIFNGKIALNGEVNTQKKQPTFDVKLGIKSFDIAQSFNSLDLLQSLSPIAGAMNGKLNSDINLSGDLNTDFTPNLTSISGKALAELLTTKINPEKTKALSLLNDKLSFIDLTKLDLTDIKTHLSFKKGQVEVSPFKLKYKDIGINVGGTHGFDQTMNYNVTFDVPAKYLGSDVQGILSKLSAKDQNITVPVTANLTGSMTSPTIKTDLSSSVTKLTQELVQRQKESLVKNTLGNLLGNKKKDSTNKTDKTVKKVTDVLGGLFGKKKKKKGGN